MPNGIAEAPQDAPPAVKQTIAAGNAIVDTFYSQERRPGMLSQVQDSYDCSGSTDFVLYNSGFSDSPLVNPCTGRPPPAIRACWSRSGYRARGDGLTCTDLPVTRSSSWPGWRLTPAIRGWRTRPHRFGMTCSRATTIRAGLTAGRDGLSPVRSFPRSWPTVRTGMSDTHPGCDARTLAERDDRDHRAGGRCGATHHRSLTPPAPPDSTSVSVTARPTPPRPRLVVRRFAGAYGAYLDGGLPADRLIGLTDAARGEIGPPIEPRYRVGQIVVASVTVGALGATSELRLRAGRCLLAVSVQVGRSDGRDVVDGVQPPDLDSILQPPAEATAEPRSAAPERTARRFLAGYLPWTTGRARPRRSSARHAGWPNSSAARHPRRLERRICTRGSSRSEWCAAIVDGRPRSTSRDDVRTYNLQLTLVAPGPAGQSAPSHRAENGPVSPVANTGPPRGRGLMADWQKRFP